MRRRLLLVLSMLSVCVICHAHSVRGNDYTIRIDAQGRITVDRGRMPIVTTSYGGMFGSMPGGGVAYYVQAGRNLEVQASPPGEQPFRLVAENSGVQGVTMRREATITPQGVRLTYEIGVPAGVEGSIDTGFTLNPEFVFGGQGTLWERAGGPEKPVTVGGAPTDLPYQSALHKALFVSPWGRLTVQFESEGAQASGALLNGSKSTRQPADWVQMLPLFASVAKADTAKTYHSACLISFEPAPDKHYVSPRRNLLYGGDFEGWANPDLPDGWRRTPFVDADTGTGLTPDSAIKYEGGRSLRWTSPDGTLVHATQWQGYYSPVRVDGPYVFSAYLRAEPQGVEVVLHCGRGASKAKVGGEWQRYSVATEITATQDLPYISLEKLSPGTLWVDAAQLEADSVATPFAARPQETLFTVPPFPKDMLADAFAKLPPAPLLSGPGPEFNYYTREAKGRLVYDVNLPPEHRAQASLLVTLRGPDGKDLLRKTIAAPLPPRVTLEFEVAKLPLGASQATAELREAGREAASLAHEVQRLVPVASGAEVKINHLTRGLWRSGDPYIPFGSDASNSREIVASIMKAQSANGFNHLHMWRGFFDMEQTAHGTVPKLVPEALTGLLDAAQACGMTVTVNLSHWLSINHFRKGRFTNPDMTDEEILKRALEVVRLAKSHPAVLGWHLIDEPDGTYCTPDWIARCYREVKREDPYHPAEINLGGSGADTLSYLDGSDYVSVDIYPVPANHIGIITPHTRIMRLGGGWRPIRWWIQSMPNHREPTALEMSNMTYQAIAEGTRFILFYNYRPSSAAAWAGLSQLAAEVKTLAPALAAEREEIAVKASEEERIVASLQRAGGRAWIIAVNRDTRPVTAEFTLPKDCVGSEAAVLFEARKVQCGGGVLKDTFEPLARHVYEVRAR